MVETGQFVFECTPRASKELGLSKANQLKLVKSLGGMRWGISNDVWSVKATSSSHADWLEGVLRGKVAFIKKPIVLT